jgi:hypothetical protein
MGTILNGPVYSAFLTGKEYSKETKSCVESTVSRLLETTTTAERPGMLLGKVQSGKTRTFLAIIALAFDNGFDCAVVLTKGTIALTEQTLERLNREFTSLIETDQVQVFDIMHLPSNLTNYELSQKLIIVCKKEDDNIRRLDDAVFNQYPQLSASRCLIIDDEADFASVGFRRTKGELACTSKACNHSPPSATHYLPLSSPLSCRWSPVAQRRETPSISFLSIPLRGSFLHNEGGYTHPPHPASLFHWETAPFFTNPFICHTSRKRARNSFSCHTSKNTDT